MQYSRAVALAILYVLAIFPVTGMLFFFVRAFSARNEKRAQKYMKFGTILLYFAIFILSPLFLFGHPDRNGHVFLFDGKGPSPFYSSLENGGFRLYFPDALSLTDVSVKSESGESLPFVTESRTDERNAAIVVDDTKSTGRDIVVTWTAPPFGPSSVVLKPNRAKNWYNLPFFFDMIGLLVGLILFLIKFEKNSDSRSTKERHPNCRADTDKAAEQKS